MNSIKTRRRTNKAKLGGLEFVTPLARSVSAIYSERNISSAGSKIPPESPRFARRSQIDYRGFDDSSGGIGVREWAGSWAGDTAWETDFFSGEILSHAHRPDHATASRRVSVRSGLYDFPPSLKGGKISI